jgi:hypothetical protein
MIQRVRLRFFAQDRPVFPDVFLQPVEMELIPLPGDIWSKENKKFRIKERCFQMSNGEVVISFMGELS